MKRLTLSQKHYYLVLTCLLVCFFSYSRQKTVATNKQVDDLLASAYSQHNNNLTDSATSLFRQAVQLSRQKGYKPGEARGYDGLAEVGLQQGQYRQASAYDSLLLPLAISLKDTVLLINVYNRMGVCHIEKGRAKEAEQYLQYALHYGLDKRQSVKTAEIFSNLGSVFLSTGDKDRAMEWFFRALKLFEAHQHEKGMGETYSNISSVYYLMGRTDEAIQFQRRSIAVREKINDMAGLIITHVNIGQLYIIKDSFPLAQQHLKTGVEYADRLKNPRLQGSAYSGMSAYYSRTKDFASALTWQAKAITIFEEMDNKQLLSRLYVSAGNTASATNDSAIAAGYYQKALTLATSLANKENIANAHEKLSSFYAARQNHTKALEHYKKFIIYKDSIAEKSALSKIEEVRTRYETEKKDNEISRLTTEQQIKELQLDKQDALIAANLLEAQKNEDEIKLLSTARQLQELHISQQQEQLEKQRLLASNKEQQLQLAEKERQLQSRLLKNSRLTRNFILAGIALLIILGVVLFNRYQLKQKIREQQSLLQVRSNIAKDLHDEIGSTLTSIKILSEVSGKSIGQDQQKASVFLQKITEQSAAAQQGMSDIVWAVKPENDKLENMVARMREYIAQSLEPQNVQTAIHIDETLLQQSLSMQQRRDFFLLFKEAVNNIAKHAAATVVNIRLDRENDHIRLMIKDNGKGFKVLPDYSSSGLKNMKARAAALGGKMTLSTFPGEGTTLEIHIPPAT